MRFVSLAVLLSGLIFSGQALAQASVFDEYSAVCGEGLTPQNAKSRLRKNDWKNAPAKYSSFFDAGNFAVSQSPLKRYKNVGDVEMVVLVSFVGNDGKKQAKRKPFIATCLVRMMANGSMAFDAKMLFSLGLEGLSEDTEKGGAIQQVWTLGQKDKVVLQLVPSQTPEVMLATAIHHWVEE